MVCDGPEEGVGSLSHNSRIAAKENFLGIENVNDMIPKMMRLHYNELKLSFLETI